MTLDLAKQYQYLMIFDSWFDTIPKELCYTLSSRDWKGRGIVWLNCLHYTIRLRLLRDKFVSSLEEIENGIRVYDSTTLVISQCTYSTANLTNIASIFSVSNLKGFQSESSFIQNCVFYAGLFNCALLLCHGQSYQSERDSKTCLEAMKKSYGGKDVNMLMWCSENRYLGAIKALDVIRKDSCWLTLKS